jgi:hypothetical protein
MSTKVSQVVLLLSYFAVAQAASEGKNVSSSGYYLQDNFSGTSFFDNFAFETMDDPTHGSLGLF